MALPKRRQPRWTLDSIEIRNHVQKDRNMLWESQSGKITEVKNIDLNHLKNILNKFKRKEYTDFLGDSVIADCLMYELIYRELIKPIENEK